MDKKIEYSDNEIAERTQYYFIKTAGYVIKIVLEPAEQIFFKRNIINSIQETWGRGGFLKKTSSIKPDFEIIFASTASEMKIVQKNDGKDHYYLTLRKDFASRRVIVFYFTSLPTLTILMKEILSFLIKNDGFLLHASSCLDNKGNLKLFLASSGGGKTTIANLLSKSKFCTKFGDDMVIVKKVKGRWFFFSPPYIEKDALPTKRKAELAEMYFVKKSRLASKELLAKKDNVLGEILKQIWASSGKLEKKVLINAMSFVVENKFYLLKTTLNAKVMQKLLYEG